MKNKRESSKVIEIPVMLVVGIVITLVTIMTFFFGTQIIMKAAKYSVSSALTTEDGRFEYRELQDGKIEITKYIGTDTEVVIPEKIDEKIVTSIGERAFQYCDDLTNITVPQNITTIDTYAFIRMF